MRAECGEVADALYGDDLAELCFDLFENIGCSAGHDGDAGILFFVVGFGDGEAFDVIAAAGKQADDAREDAGLIVANDRKCVGFDGHVLRPGGVYGF